MEQVTDKFIREDLEFYLPETFRELTKEYILECIFNDEIQKNWKPQEGDVMVGCTGNIWVIASKYDYHESIGGTMYFFGGTIGRIGGVNQSIASCHTMNESGKWIEEGTHFGHSSIKNFRFIPVRWQKII